MELAWAAEGAARRLVVRGAPPTATVRVVPTAAIDGPSSPVALPATPGVYDAVAGGVEFTPRFPFVGGRSYTVLIDDRPVGTIDCPQSERLSTTEVVAIHPVDHALPRNALRLYVTFSAPMSEGFASCIYVADAATGAPLADALLPTDEELWDPKRRRLTVLFDPGRIKRGLVPHREQSYPLRLGRTVRVEVDRAMPDATGAPLARSAARTYAVGPDLRGRVDPLTWLLSSPAAGTRAPLTVDFDRPLDHALAGRCLAVADVVGTVTVAGDGRSWTFAPDTPWSPGRHLLVVDPVLEDVAGNAVARAFERDLDDPADEPAPSTSVRLTFAVS